MDPHQTENSILDLHQNVTYLNPTFLFDEDPDPSFSLDPERQSCIQLKFFFISFIRFWISFFELKFKAHKGEQTTCKLL